MTTNPGLLEYGGSNTPGYMSNLGITYAGGTFSITDAQGAALSTNNPGWVTVPSTTGGQLICLPVTAATHTFDDDAGTSNLTNLGFGITETVNWSNQMPWFLYVVNEDDTAGGLGFFIARAPNLIWTPAAGLIHDYDGAAGTDTQASIFGMWNDDAGKANKNSALIGAFRMTWSTATDDWTVAALNNFQDGLGYGQINKILTQAWSFPLGQNGAASGTYLIDNGGTAPIQSTNNYVYSIGLDGYCTVSYNSQGDGGTDGAGAVISRITIPYASNTITGGTKIPIGLTTAATTITSGAVTMGALENGATNVGLQYPDTATSLASITNAMFTNGGREIQGSFRYKAF